MFKAGIVEEVLAATPALSQVTIAENGIQIAAPGQGFSLYDSDEFFRARLWLHDTIPLYSITIMNKQDPENRYSGMDWSARAWDPIVSQAADIITYSQGLGWVLAEGEISENGFFQRSIIKQGCPVIATLIVEFPQEKRAVAEAEFTHLSESLAIAPSPICP